MRIDHRSRVASWLWVLGLVSGCGSTAPSGPPQIKLLETNATTLDDGASFSIVATVTDPNGQSDLVGGTLRTADGKLVGAFTAKSNGLFQIDVGWPAFAAVAPFSFYGSETRAYKVSFTDFDGHEASQALSLTFRCADRSGACGSSCQRLDLDSACGKCGTQCAEGQQCNASLDPPSCGPRLIGFDDLGQQFATAFCNMVFNCCDPGSLVKLMQSDHFSDPAGCIYIFAVAYSSSSMRESVESGRTTYSPEGAGTCLTAFEKAGCDVLSRPASPCTTFIGAQPTGGDCADMRECPTGDSCEIPSGQQMGICRVYLTVGATCVPQVALCEPNTLYCDSTTTKCALRKPEGATCVTVSECQAGLECTASKCVKQEASCALLF